MDTEQKQNGTVKTKFANEKGFLLIAALTLLTVLALLGTTAYILSSTDIKIGSNYRNTQLALQVAIGGAEQARAKLVSDLYPTSGSLVSLSTKLAAVKGPNNVLNGYASGSDDIVLASGSLNGATYVAYLTSDTLDANGQYSTTDSNSKALITSVATGPSNATARVEMVVYSPAGLASTPGAVYSKGDVTGGGDHLTIDGTDACGVETGKKAVYTTATSSLNGDSHLTGGVTTMGSTNIDIASYIDALKNGAATSLTADVTSSTTYGTSTNYTTVYSDTNSPPNAQGLTLQNVTGYGILLVKGDLVLKSGFQWNGTILATGSVTLDASGGNINIQGLILTGTNNTTDITVSGTNTIRYDSCKVKNSLGGGVRMVNWKQTTY